MKKDSKAQKESKRDVARRTVGLDVGDRYSHYCLLDAGGQVLQRGRVRTTAQGLTQAFGSLSAARFGLETGTHSGWVSRLLEGLGHPVIVGNARELERIHRSHRKNDRADAEILARLTRFDPQLMSPVRHRSAEAQADLAVLRARDALVRARTLLINSARGLVKTLGYAVPGGSAETFPRRVGEHVPSPGRAALGGVLTQIEELTKSIAGYDYRVQHLARTKYPQTQRLEQVSGVGPVTSLAFVLTLGDKDRFRKSREVGPYLGLVPRQDASGERSPELRITKAGDEYLRRLLVGSAQYILGPFGPDSHLRRHGLELAGRGGKNAKKRAVVAVARKLAVLLHRLWVTGEVYDPWYPRPPATAA